MGSFRTERVGQLLKELISEVVRDLKDPRIGFATLTEVQVTPDLKHAKIYVSVLGTDDEKKESLEGLNSAKGFIRREITPNLSLRCIPDLSFTLDRSIENGVRMAALINQAAMADKKMHEHE